MHPLYIVATPIGNLKDITLRALEVLKQAPVIICERPRHTQKLLNHFDITGKTVLQYTEANRNRMTPKIIELLTTRPAALVVDAGTPGVSDPGTALVAAVWKSGGRAIPIPGPSALTAAISISGIGEKGFIFIGFLPRTLEKTRRLVQEFSLQRLPIIAYEAPHRIVKTLSMLNDHFPERNVSVFKELTKAHETAFFGEPSEVLEALTKDPQNTRGEFVIFIH
ncbi:MAG: 16S rRNA (cytidine(1402)-2'-O)-methyltransferase [Parcubacteria group bacterium]|nr:16S rRNA (cytidine(1402)-2'-O)-methyltransferase [Parcubacteria group bacterium]